MNFIKKDSRKKLVAVNWLLILVVIISLCTPGMPPALGAPRVPETQEEGELPSGASYSEIEAVIDAYVEKHESTTAAVSVAVFNNDNVLLEKAYGYSDIENAVVNDKDTVFEWGSVTKLLVWVSVMQLAEQGKIDLDEDIRTYLPQNFLTKLQFDTPINMYNVMHHNAGWQETGTNLFVKDKSDLKSLGETLRLIEPDQVNEPGSVVAYSNWGSAMAGYIVEQVSGQSFDTYVKQHIFDPLGMQHTAVHPTLSDNPWVAAQRTKQKHYTPDNRLLGTSLYHIPLYPAGMATGTLEDFIIFGQAILGTGANGEKSPLFSEPSTLEEMLSPSLFFADGVTPRNCHGFWTDGALGVPVLYHNGGTRGSTSWLAFNVESGIGMITLTNQPQEQVYNGGLLPVVFGKYQETEEMLPGEDISGTYMASRSIFKGYAKPYSLISTMRLVPDGEQHSKYTISRVESTVHHLGQGAYLLNTAGAKQYIVYAATNDKGQTMLQFPGQDFIETNTPAVLGKFVLLVLFVAGGLYGLIALVLALIGFFKDKNNFGTTTKYQTIVNASVVAALLLFIRVSVIMLSGTAIFEDIRWSLVTIGLLSLIPVGYLVYLLNKWKQLNPHGKEKIKLILTGMAGLVMTINVIFWQTYKFW